MRCSDETCCAIHIVGVLQERIRLGLCTWDVMLSPDSPQYLKPQLSDIVSQVEQCVVWSYHM